MRRKSKLIPTENSHRKSALEAVEKVLETRHARESAPYDGLLGLLPTWMPDPLVREFEYYRAELLDQYEAEEIQKWRKRRADDLKPPRRRRVLWYPLELGYKLDSLNYIQSIASRGQSEGIKAYLGESAEPVYREEVMKPYEKDIERAKRMSQGKPRGAFGPLTKFVIQIVQSDPNLTFVKGAYPRVWSKLKVMAKERHPTVEKIERGPKPKYDRLYIKGGKEEGYSREAVRGAVEQALIHLGRIKKSANSAK